MNDIKTKNSLGHSFIYTAIVTAIIGFVNYGYPVIIGLIYSAQVMARFSILYYWSMILCIPIINGIAPAVARFLAANSSDKIEQFETEGVKLTTFYLLLPFAIFPAISLTILEFSIMNLLLVLSLIFLISYHYIFRKSFQGQEKFSYLIKIESISFGFFIPSVIIFSILPKVLEWEIFSSYYFLFLPIIIYHVTFIFIILLGKFKEINFRELFKFSEITKRILRYSFFIGFGDFLTVGISQAQIIISDSFLIEYEVGVLSFLNSAIMPVTLLSVTLAFMLLPRVTNLQHSNSKLELSFVNRLNWSFSLIILPVAGLFFLLFGAYPEFLDIITLSKYQMTFYWPVLVFLISQIIYNLLSVPSLTYFSSSEKSVLLRMISSIIYTIAIILSWIFIVPLYGIFGFAIGYLIGGIISSITVQAIALIITKNKIGLHIFFVIGCSTLITGFVILLNYTSSILLISIWSLIAIPAIVYGIIILIKVLKNQDYSKRYNVIEEQKNEVEV